MTSRRQNDKNWGGSQYGRGGSSTLGEISPHLEPSAPSSSPPLIDEYHEELPAGQNDNGYSSYPVATGYTGYMGSGEDWPCTHPSGDVNDQEVFSVYPAPPPNYSVPSMSSSGAASSSSPSNTASNPSLLTDGATPGTQSSYRYTATFQSGTMIEVQEEPRKKLDKEKRMAIRENRNKVCEKHKRSKKKCDPEKCLGNAQYKERHPQPQQTKADESPRTTLHHPTASLPLQMDNSQASIIPPSLHGESEIETHPLTTTRLSSSFIPRRFSAIKSYGPYILENGERLIGGSFIMYGTGEALTRKDDSGGNGGGNGEGNGGQSDERGDQGDYGDYWKGYDADWADGKGPGDSGDMGSGGGYEKPGGGYYALSLKMKAEAKLWSLTEALSNFVL